MVHSCRAIQFRQHITTSERRLQFRQHQTTSVKRKEREGRILTGDDDLGDAGDAGSELVAVGTGRAVSSMPLEINESLRKIALALDN